MVKYIQRVLSIRFQTRIGKPSGDLHVSNPGPLLSTWINFNHSMDK